MSDTVKFIESDNLFIGGFDTIPIAGYEPTFNPETGRIYPYCCENHKAWFNSLQAWYEKFPNCCEEHKGMIGKWWFRRSNYDGIVEKIMRQSHYTEYHIFKQSNQPDWEKDIKDYIEYNCFSFGQPAIGLNRYLEQVKSYLLSAETKIPKYKKKILITFIDEYGIKKESKQTDVKILLGIYEKWFREFPFELNSYFGKLKDYFKTHIHILKERPVVNKYSGMAKAQLHTKETLFEALLNLTDALLTKINGVTLYELGIINDANLVKLELILNERKFKLKQGYINTSPNEDHRYRKMIKEWYKDEKKFINEITPLLKPSPPQQTETKTEQESENDFTLSTIEDWLFEFKKLMADKDYKSLVSALKYYFDCGVFPKQFQPIQINGRPNKKLFGWALNRIFEAKGKGIEKDLLLFAKQNISLFTDVQFDENNILKSNLYKYFTTKTV